jgi:hypothetical protein
VRTAVAGLQQELNETNRTELPGIGIFRRAAGRGLAFEYTGTDNLLAAAFGLPELAARPVRANDARAKRPQPVLRGATTRRSRWARLVPGGVIAMAAGLLLLVNYQIAQNAGYLPAAWQTQLPQLAWAQSSLTASAAEAEPQQATLGQHDFSRSSALESEGITPLETAATTPVPEVKDQPTAASPEAAIVAANSPAAAAAKAEPAAPAKTVAPAPEAAKPVAVVAATPAVAKAPAAPATTKSITIKQRTGRYYVIAGAYSSLKGAERGRQVLARTGHATHIILPPLGSRLFRLTAADYPDLASAQREAQRLRISTRCDYNTLKF